MASTQDKKKIKAEDLLFDVKIDGFESTLYNGIVKNAKRLGIWPEDLEYVLGGIKFWTFEDHSMIFSVMQTDYYLDLLIQTIKVLEIEHIKRKQVKEQMNFHFGGDHWNCTK